MPARPGRVLRSVVVALAVGGLAAACGGPKASATRPAAPAAAGQPSSSADTQFYIDVATADPDLGSYVNENSQIAPKALLADGIDLCYVLDHGGSIDDAMTSVAAGANQVEPETGLPRSVKTFNAIDASALLALCPAEQRVLPASDQASLKQLAQAIAANQPTSISG